MDKDNQIDEMARGMVDTNNKEAADALALFFVKAAEHLYNAGYRKQSEGEWKPIMTVCNRGACSECDEVGAVRWKYCPHCGAKMKGGAE